MKNLVGIDIQTRRDCCYAVLNESGKLEKSGWFTDPISDAKDFINELKSSSQVAVGVDAPRVPLISER